MMSEDKPEALDYVFDVLYDIKDTEQLRQEVEYLTERLFGIAALCRGHSYSIDEYLKPYMKELK